MSAERQITTLENKSVKTKRGLPVYRTNPSVPDKGALPTRTKRITIPGGKETVIVNNSTGEILGQGGMGFWKDEEVDRGRFVKLFLDGIKQAAGLSKAGIQVFELVYNEVRDNPGKDEIKLSYDAVRDRGLELSDRTYQRGIRELLEKEFLFRSMYEGTYFVNIRFMFNGDRLAFVKTYHLKNASLQAELPLEALPALPSPDTV